MHELAPSLSAGITVAVVLLATSLITWTTLNQRVRTLIDDDPRFQVAYAVALAQRNTSAIPAREARYRQRQTIGFARSRAEDRGPAHHAATIRDRATAAHMVIAVLAGAITTMALTAGA